MASQSARSIRRIPCNRGIVNIDKAPRNARGFVEYRSDICILRPADPQRGNGRILHEVNNRGRMLLFASLCGGKPGNQPQSAADLGNALPLRRGFILMCSGWDPGAPRANGGLGMDAPVATNDGAPIVRRIREEFISGTRGGALERFRLSYETASLDPREARLTVRRTQTAPRHEVAAWRFIDARTVQLLPDGTLPEPGSIYELYYQATKPRVLGIGFAATRDIISHLRHTAAGRDLLGRRVDHALAFGISQAGRYLRDHIAQGFNGDENGARVFDGVFTHVAGIGRVFHNTEFGQPARTRTWHEDHDFPEVQFPFSAAMLDDRIGGGSGALLRGDDSDPKLIETNTSTEYWQKGASLLHTDPDGERDVALPENVRGYYLPGTQHGGKAGMPRDAGPCTNPRNWHDPMPAIRALLIALDEWVVSGREPPPSRLPRIADGSLVPRGGGCLAEAFRAGAAARGRRRRATRRLDTIRSGPHAAGMRWCRKLMPMATRSPASACRTSQCRAERTPVGTCTRHRFREGELADREGTYLAFAATLADRKQSGDPRASLTERYPDHEAYVARVQEVVAALQRDRLLLDEDAEAYRAHARG